LSLFPNEDILTKEEIESWKAFVDSLDSKEDRELFKTMLNDCYKYTAAINVKGQPFPAEPLIMASLLLILIISLAETTSVLMEPEYCNMCL
jgi:hypothetical protein